MTIFHRDITSEFHRSANRACRSADQFLKEWGVVVAGAVGIAGGLLQGCFAHQIAASVGHGLLADPRIQMVAAACNIISPVAALVAGRHHLGVKLSAIAGLVGTVLTFGPKLLTGDLLTWGSFAILAGALMVNFLSDDHAHRNEGSPLFRKIGGLLLFVSHASVAVVSLFNGQWRAAAPFAAWSGGDLAYSRSHPQRRRPAASAVIAITNSAMVPAEIALS